MKVLILSFWVSAAIMASVAQAMGVTYQMVDSGTLGGDYSYAYGINDAGEVVGYSQTDSGYAHAFLYDGAMP